MAKRMARLSSTGSTQHPRSAPLTAGERRALVERPLLPFATRIPSKSWAGAYIPLPGSGDGWLRSSSYLTLEEEEFVCQLLSAGADDVASPHHVRPRPVMKYRNGHWGRR